MKKYNYKDDFEKVYLRQEYALRCEKLDGKYVKEFAGVIHTTTKIMFNKLYPNFIKVGLHREDIASVASLYVIYYMELYSLRNHPERRERYIAKYIEKKGSKPSDATINNYDRNSMINFLRQKIHHIATLSARKARNITVGVDRRGSFAKTENSVDAHDLYILKDYKKYGYRKVTQAELKAIKLKAKETNAQELVDKDGFQVIEIEMLNGGISYRDYNSLIKDDNNSVYCHDPEQIFRNNQVNRVMEEKRESFNKSKKSYKRRKLLNFIEQNKDSKYLKKELTLARKLLLRKEIMV